MKSTVVEIESDDMPWSHNPDQLDAFTGAVDQRVFGGKNQEQFMYNQFKKNAEGEKDNEGPQNKEKKYEPKKITDEEFKPSMFKSQ